MRARLRDESGEVIEDVSIWPDYPDFEALRPGDQTSGRVEVNSRGFRSLKATDSGRRESAVAGFATRRPVGAADERRNEAMKVAQDRKYQSIAFFNATNSAIALVSAMRQGGTVADRISIKNEVIYWRDWFLSEWKKHESGDESRI